MKVLMIFLLLINISVQAEDEKGVAGQVGKFIGTHIAGKALDHGAKKGREALERSMRRSGDRQRRERSRSDRSRSRAENANTARFDP